MMMIKFVMTFCNMNCPAFRVEINFIYLQVYIYGACPVREREGGGVDGCLVGEGSTWSEGWSWGERKGGGGVGGGGGLNRDGRRTGEE